MALDATAVQQQQRASAGLFEELQRAVPMARATYVPHSISSDNDTIVVDPARVLDVAHFLKSRFPSLLDVCGVDYPGRDKRFDVIYNYANLETNNRIRIKAQIADGEDLPSVMDAYKAADWFEREAFDMFGIRFKGHYNLRRILCHEDFVGYPLRKDYPADRNQELKTPIEHVYKADRERLLAAEDDHLSDKVWINIGPAHPATHGTLRLMAVLSGETIEKIDVEIGYLHRCFEKMCESHNYNQIIPYTDRLNYCSAPINNNVWARTIEKMLGIKAPDRAEMMRLILDEFSRIIDHFVCISTNAVDLGGLTNFWLGFQARERVYDLFEKLCGARLTVSLTRVGGMGFDLPKGWVADAKEVLKDIEKAYKEVDLLCTKNRIFVKRMVGAGKISAEDAIAWGFTGPCLRACGVPWDARVYAPYSFYDQVKFDVPIADGGDSYARYMVRMEEIQQSLKILRQCLDNIPSGPVSIDNPAVVLPDKENVYGDIEGLMNQFMLVIHGVKVPPMEYYGFGEGANGELGFYVVSDGSGTPYRVKCRPPCFAVFQAFPQMVTGGMMADAIAALGSINIIAGELDR